MSLRKKIAFSLLATGLFLIVLEILLNTFGDFPATRVLCYDTVLGDVYCPNTEGQLHKDIDKYIKVNSDGLVDKDYPVDRVPGKLRIAVLGDSFAAAEEIEPGKKFHDLWEERLPRRLGRPVEVLNFGVRGKGTFQELQMFHLKAARYKPDLTVLAFFWGNDVENNLGELKNGQLNPLLGEYPVDSGWEKFVRMRRNFNKWLWNHFALYQFTRDHYNKLEQRVKGYFRSRFLPAPAIAASAAAAPRPAWLKTVNFDEIKKDTPSIFDDRFFFDSEGWELTRRLILRLRDEVRDNGGKLVVIHFLGLTDYKIKSPLPLKEFDDFLTREKIKYIDLSAKFGNMEEKELVENFIPGDFHFNVAGHDNFARFTIDLLARELPRS
ncbi:MAG: SGNH/GDSL hydrolase family protein [Nitrospinales bacterium]